MHANLFKPALLTSLILLAACSEEPYSPIVDGRKSANFQQDLGACRTVAQKAQLSNQSTTADAVVGGLVGAADADDGDELEGAIAGAVVGGLLGRASGNEELDERRERIVFNCMRDRGHRVVG
ncbi:MAG: glycine zipper family protein [Pseudomonadota bacterium]